MKDLVLYLVRGLANEPDRVEASEREDDDGVTVELTVAENDKGRVIGKQGKVIKAIRAVVGAAAAKAGKRSAVDVE